MNTEENSVQQLKDVIIGMIFLYLYVKRQLVKNCLKEHYITLIVLSTNDCHTDPRTFLDIFVYFPFSLFLLFYPK